MPDLTHPLELLRLKRDHILAEFAHIGDLPPGSLVDRYRKCGKPSCHCAAPGAHSHGPSCWLTHPGNSETATHIIPRGPAVEHTRERIAEYHRFRGLVWNLVEVSERLCDLQLRIALRCCKLSGRFQDFREHRSRKNAV